VVRKRGNRSRFCLALVLDLSESRAGEEWIWGSVHPCRRHAIKRKEISRREEIDAIQYQTIQLVLVYRDLDLLLSTSSS
jgi:hypothetical protein